MAPDPVAGDIVNPQSLNRYAYVLNSPTSLIDPLGLDIWCNTLIDENGNVVGYTNCIDTGTTVYGGGPEGGLRGGSGSTGGGGVGGKFPPRYESVDGGHEGPHGERRGGTRGPFEELEPLVVGLNALTTPFQNAAVGLWISGTGAAVIGISVYATVAVCSTTGPVVCGAFVTFGAVPTAGGGVVLVYTGYRWTRDVTIPSFVSLYNGLRGH